MMKQLILVFLKNYNVPILNLLTKENVMIIVQLKLLK